MENKLKKLVGIKKSEFDEFIKENENGDKGIFLQEARLIPVQKPGDEMALTSVFLAGLRLIKEFRDNFFADAKIKKGKIFAYREVSFGETKTTNIDSRIDGVILVVKSGKIIDAAFFEMKNKTDVLDEKQINRYIEVAKKYKVPKLITISNQFVSKPTQSPIRNIKKTKGVEVFHFSWSYILTLAQILLFKTERIEDQDQIAIMKEIVSYFEHEKSGISEFSQMKSGWKKTSEAIISGTRLKKTDNNILETVESWIQEEKNMALKLSTKLGLFVKAGYPKYKDDISVRIKNDIDELIEKKRLKSNLEIKNATSNIEISAFFDRRVIEMSVSLIPPSYKSTRSKITWLKYQLYKVKRNERDDDNFKNIINNLKIELVLKGNSKNDKINLKSIDDSYYKSIEKYKEIKEFKIVIVKDFGSNFNKPREFVKTIEEMLLDYYKLIVQYLKKEQPIAPKINEKPENLSSTKLNNLNEVNNKES